MVHTTVVSSPGKVLIAGGYLVLDPTYSGTVVSTSSRFYTTVQDGPSKALRRIRVRSPQFNDAEWEYIVSFEQAYLSVEPTSASATKNKFVHLALRYTLALVAEVIGTSSLSKALSTGLDIAIVADNDFYSQSQKLVELNLPKTTASLTQLPHFMPTGTTLKDVHKTGLGSSAALITSLVSALLFHLCVISQTSFGEFQDQSPSKEPYNGIEGKKLAHNLAQLIHCLAQGKIGSGFDIAAAVFGSQIYTRFNPRVIQAFMEGDAEISRPLLPVISPRNQAWDYRTEPFALPPLTRIMLADVAAGSDTPSLAGKVLKWRKESEQEANTLWRSLNQLNQSLGQALVHLSKLHASDPKNYESAVKYISSLQPVQWEANPWQPPAELPIVASFYDAHRISQSIRAKMREMGNLARVPIEPPEQTKLLDICVSQAGVIGGGVPGAGGYDAIWVLVCDPIDCYPDQRPSERIERLWSVYSDSNVCPLTGGESAAKGIHIETLDNVPGLKEAISVKNGS